jgi:hypothetical protein
VGRLAPGVTLAQGQAEMSGVARTPLPRSAWIPALGLAMAAQTSLVDIFARFDPRLVRMAPAGEAPQD